MVKLVKRTLFIMLSMFLLLSNNLIFASEYKAAKIDLSFILVLHPKMSLFDFNRLGFYKTELSLSNKEFYNEIRKIRKNTIDEKIEIEIKTIKNKIIELNKELNNLNKISKNSTKESNKIAIQNISNQITLLRKRLKDIEFDAKNNEITKFDETKRILFEINNEVMESIKEVAKEQDISIVFNDSQVHKNSFPTPYETRSAFKKNKYKHFTNDYYEYLSIAVKLNEFVLPSSVYLSQWLEMARLPDVIEILPFDYQHIVVGGAEDITMEVIKKIYCRYNISLDFYTRIEKIFINRCGTSFCH